MSDDRLALSSIDLLFCGGDTGPGFLEIDVEASLADKEFMSFDPESSS